MLRWSHLRALMAAHPLRWWVYSRVLVLTLLFTVQQSITGDVYYYATELTNLVLNPDGVRVGMQENMVEYPYLTVLVLLPLWFVTIGPHALNTPLDLLAAHQVQVSEFGIFDTVNPAITTFGSYSFHALFILLLLAIDFALFRALQRHGNIYGVRAWILAGVAIGPLAYTRLDLAAGAAAAGALLLYRDRPAGSGVMSMVGVGAKLWPIVMAPVLFLYRPSRWRMVAGFSAALVVFVLVGLLVGGVDRIISPLTWQSVRGLQIESILATPFMALWAFDPVNWQVFYSEFNTNEIIGPGTNIANASSSALLALGFCYMAVVWLRGLRRSVTLNGQDLGWIALAGTSILIVTSRVLSPQFLWWITPLAVVTLAISTPPHRPGQDPAAVAATRRLIQWVWVLFGLGVLTQVIFPITYGWVIEAQPLSIVGAAMLTIRNVGLLILTVAACVEAWRVTKASSGNYPLTRERQHNVRAEFRLPDSPR